MRIIYRLIRVLLAAALALLTFIGVSAAGVATSMPDLNPARAMPARGWPGPAPAPAGRLRVAVVAGTSGSVITDLLAPYEVFASSPAFFVYTVSAFREPVTLFGGPSLLPDHTLAEVESSPELAPDVVVVPAVGDPTGSVEAPLRGWITRQGNRGARILGVCAGSELLAAAGVLDGHRATSTWAGLDDLQTSYPRVSWVRGQRYVQDGPVTTTAAVTSGIPGALRLVEQLAGAPEATRVGKAFAYPGWSIGAPTDIPVNRRTAADVAMDLNFAFPSLRETVGVRLEEGVGEIDLAAAFDVMLMSASARAVPIATRPVTVTRHGAVLLAPSAAGARDVDRLLVPGAGFGAALRDLAVHSDRATAGVAAKYLEFPASNVQLSGNAWPWRPTMLLVLALASSIGVGLFPGAVWKVVRRRRTRAGAASAAEANEGIEVLVKT